MKVLVVGSNGQLGTCLQDRIPREWDLTAVDQQQLDITDAASVAEWFDRITPDVVINASAYTAVDLAEDNEIIARKVNALGAAELAKQSWKHGAQFFHVSTDYVFDGEKITPYTESDITNPQSVYGVTKLEGERLVFDYHPKAVVFRTAWVFSEYGNNFVKTMLRLAKTKESISVVADQFGCPTYAGDLASAIIDSIKSGVPSGLYHYCGNEEVSWYEFSVAILQTALEKSMITNIPLMNAISTEQYPVKAKRPRYSVLSCEKIKSVGLVSSNWKSSLDLVLDKLK